MYNGHLYTIEVYNQFYACLWMYTWPTVSDEDVLRNKDNVANNSFIHIIDADMDEDKDMNHLWVLNYLSYYDFDNL